MNEDRGSDTWSASDAERFGEALTLLRRRTGMSQRRLADLSKSSPTTISILESGKKSGRSKPVRPTEPTIRRIARALATDLADERTVREQDEATNYHTLMQAARYGLSGTHDQPAMTLSDTLTTRIRETFGDHARAIEDFFLQAGELDGPDREFVLDTVQWCRRRIERARAYQNAKLVLTRP